MDANVSRSRCTPLSCTETASACAVCFAMFKYFPTNYVWNLSVDLAIEMGARIGEIEEMCAPLAGGGEAGR